MWVFMNLQTSDLRNYISGHQPVDYDQCWSDIPSCDDRTITLARSTLHLQLTS